MKYYCESETHISAECGQCKKVLKIKKEYARPSASGFTLSPPVKCFCGLVSDSIFGNQQELSPHTLKCGTLKCGKCGSTNLHSDKKGFGLGKAAVGGIALGPVGLLGGFFGSKKIYITCLNCGNKWNI
jgi:tellurium resistance protein TerD